MVEEVGMGPVASQREALGPQAGSSRAAHQGTTSLQLPFLGPPVFQLTHLPS